MLQNPIISKCEQSPMCETAVLTGALGLIMTLGAAGWPCLLGVPGPLPGCPAAPGWGI